MTGARFPDVPNDQNKFDAVIKVEDAVVFDLATSSGSTRCIRIIKPVARHAHKRVAGSDFQKGEPVTLSRETVRPHHIMALASLGIDKIEVFRKPRIGVWSTGNELLGEQKSPIVSSKINDANGPYLQASLSGYGADVVFLGVMDDEPACFQKALERTLQSEHCDMLISSGAVSRGKLDFVPSCLKELGGTTLFHGVSMRPGHPVLFATLPRSLSKDNTQHNLATMNPRPFASPRSIPFFGLPGNPIVAAACIRFLVLPFLNSVEGRENDFPVKAMLRTTDTSKERPSKTSTSTKAHLDMFQHGQLSMDRTMGWTVVPSSDQSPAKLKPFSKANCWLHIASDLGSSTTTNMVDCYLL